MLQLLRREKYYPSYSAPSYASSITASVFQVTTGYQLDFSDGVFKLPASVASTTRAMTQVFSTEQEYVYTTGISLPNQEDLYKCVFYDQDSTPIGDGELIQVAGGPVGVVVATTTNTTTSIKTDIPMSNDGELNYRWMLLNDTELQQIASCVAATGVITVSNAYTSVPAASTTVSLIP